MRAALSALALIVLLVGVASVGGVGAGVDRAAAGGNRDIEVEPKRISPGKNLTVRGHGFVARQQIKLKAGRVGGRVRTIEIIRTGQRGGFNERFRVQRRTGAGRFVIRACRRSCELREQARFRVKRR